MNFFFVKQIDVLKNSIFYSLVNYKEQVLGFGRNHWNERVIREVALKSNNWELLDTPLKTYIGEDPRCFYFNNNLYILDNYLNDNHLICYDTGESQKLNIDGKNFSFFQHNEKLYFIHYIKPFSLYSYDTISHKITNIDVEDDGIQYNYEFRGGTPGYKKRENEYYGFGHKKYFSNNILIHDIFYWEIIWEENKLPRISHYEMKQPIGSRNICDPTSVIEINNKKYLVTAETDYAWFFEQEYVTNIYEIIEK